MKKLNDLLNEKIDIKELEQFGFIIEPNNYINIEDLKSFLDKNNIKKNELAQATGIPRQNITAILKGDLKPGLDFALKVSTVLNLQVEDLFKISNEWTSPIKFKDFTSFIYDFYTCEIITGKERTKRFKEDNCSYFNKNTKEMFSEKEFLDLQEDFISDNLDIYIKKIELLLSNREEKVLEASIEKMAKDLMKEIFNKKYQKRYMKIVKKIIPIKLITD